MHTNRPPARLKYPPDLGKDPGGIGNRAENKCDADQIDRAIGYVESFRTGGTQV